jgi:hypothetical protein
MPLYFKNKQGLCCSICDHSKLTQVLTEFNKDPQDQDFVIYVDCAALFYHPDFDAYNFDHVSNDKMDLPAPIAVPGTYRSPSPMTPTAHTPSLLPIFLHKLPTSVKAQYDAYQAGTALLHYTILENGFLWEDGALHKYYRNDQVAYQWIFLNMNQLMAVTSHACTQHASPLMMSY